MPRRGAVFVTMEQTFTRLYWLAFLALVSIGSARAGQVHVYTVAVDPGLKTIGVQACFHGQPPRRLTSASGQAARYLQDAHVVGSGTRLRTDGRYLLLGRLRTDACIRYTVDAEAAISRDARAMGLANRVGDDLVTSPQLWFWRPRVLKADDNIELRFELPEGINVSVPWKTIERQGRRVVCHVGHAPYQWSASVAFGRFAVDPVQIGDMTLRLAVLNGSPRADPAKMRQWLSAAMKNVHAAYGSLPRQSPQIMVVPIGERDEPVPFGRVVRGGAPAVQFFVDPSHRLTRFTGDWTATHEFSHLLLPYVSRNDAWLSEGLATYYQNVLMARAGEYSETRAWQKLHEGFRRGQRNTTPGESLAEATRNMRSDGTYMRVYWSGTAMFLLADLELRRRSDGRISLDEALRRLDGCCLPSNRMWTARDLMEQLDALLGETVFVALYERHVNSSRFPGLDGAYDALGISVRNDEIRLLKDAPLAQHRKAIMVGGAVQEVALGSGTSP